MKSLAEIKQAAAQASGVGIKEIDGKSRFVEIVIARHLFCWLADDIGHHPRAIAGSIGKERTNAIYSCMSFDERLILDPKIWDMKQRAVGILIGINDLDAVATTG